MSRRSRCASIIATRGCGSAHAIDCECGSCRPHIVVDALDHSKAEILTTYKLKKIAQNVITTILVERDVHEAEVSVLFVDDNEMQDLNKRHRNIDKPTDVLAFALRESSGPSTMQNILGDIVVSVPTAKRQADERKHCVGLEIACLLIHGLLHLLGYDHANDEQEAEMRNLEKAYFDIYRNEKKLAR